MTRRRAVALAVVLAAASGCSRDRYAPSTAHEALRVVSLAPSTTESLFAIGAGDRVVGRSRYCDWPTEAARLPAVGGLQPDVEAILELHPDLVVGPQSDGSPRLAERLEARAIATWFPTTDSLSSIDDLLLGLGERTGHAPGARRFVDELDAREHAIEQAVALEPHPRVLMVVGSTPVVVAGPRSYADQLLGRAGAINVVATGPAWPTLGLEAIVELDPDLVIDSSGGAEGRPHVTRDAPGWDGVRAVRDGHVMVMNDVRVLRPGPRIGEGLAVMARTLHPAAVIP
jgi:iron complex transport system substrate-binding protein